MTDFILNDVKRGKRGSSSRAESFQKDCKKMLKSLAGLFPFQLRQQSVLDFLTSYEPLAVSTSSSHWETPAAGSRSQWFCCIFFYCLQNMPLEWLEKPHERVKSPPNQENRFISRRSLWPIHRLGLHNFGDNGGAPTV